MEWSNGSVAQRAEEEVRRLSEIVAEKCDKDEAGFYDAYLARNFMKMLMVKLTPAIADLSQQCKKRYEESYGIEWGPLTYRVFSDGRKGWKSVEVVVERWGEDVICSKEYNMRNLVNGIPGGFMARVFSDKVIREVEQVLGLNAFDGEMKPFGDR